MKTGKQLMETWFEQVWNQKNESLVSEMMSETCEIKGLGLDERGPEAFLGFYRTFQEAFDDIKIELVEQVEEGDSVLANCRFSGRHSESGKDVDFMFSAHGRWEDGKLVEARNVVDFLSMLTQIGALDASVLSKALSA